MKVAQENPSMLVYVVDTDQVLDQPDYSGCFGLKIVDEQVCHEKGKMWNVIKAIECPYTLLLASTPPLTKSGLSAHLELINPDSKWDEMGVAYSLNPFDFRDDDPRAILKATRRSVKNHLGLGLESGKNLRKVYELVMLRREEIDASSIEEIYYADLDNIKLSPTLAILQSIEVVENVLKITLDSVTVRNTKKRQADEEITLPQCKRLRRDQHTIIQHQTSFDNTNTSDTMISATRIISSIWRYIQSWR